LRRRPLLIAFGIVLIVVGAVVMWYVVAMLKDTIQVVAARVDVPRGEILKATDLVTVEIRPDPSLRTIPAASLESLVGQRVVSDLSAGGLVVPEAVSEKLSPEPDQALVGVPLTLGQQMPGIVPRLGQPIALVAFSDDKETSVFEADGIYEAVVVAVTAVTDTQVALTVSVPTATAATLTRLSALGKLAVYFESEG
jgi:hypothetical protein